MKQDEKNFLMQFFQRCQGKKLLEQITPRDLINEPGFNIHYKRAWYLLEKWSNRGLYDYGVTSDLGWLTEKGKQLAIELINTNNGVNQIIPKTTTPPSTSIEH
jgi:hypothetical protein